ncbi:MAG: tRNA pseudouridine(38-40) synthase TruA [Bacteroidetes bacterium GWA2_30_7]|nr:MAG: tRNA pseudouridine(38-40) synthase TruA [Bacteroidetes bacterium GWA2_30_7]
MKHRYFVHLAYNGTNFFGWQIQKKNITVQAVLSNCFSKLLNEDIMPVGAGRTDTGVHASYYIAHIDTSVDDLHLNKSFIKKINSFLPPDIVIYGIYKVSDEAHARFSAISRTYKYYINNIKNPFRNEFSYFWHGNLNIEKMNEACKILFEYDDFECFSKLHSDTKTNICKILKAEWTKDENGYVFTIKADRFLRNMVRAIVGTMFEIGTEKITIADFHNIIKSKNRSNSGKSFPSKGLFLVDIEYPNEVEISK